MGVTPLPPTAKAGDLAGYRVVITNTGRSNISQVYLTNALDTTDALIDPAVAADPHTVLPIAYVASSQGTCNPVDVEPPIVDVNLFCALGAIRANKSATVTVAYETELDWTQLQVIFEANTTGVAGDSQGSSHGDVRQGVGTTVVSDSDNFGGGFVLTSGATVADSQDLGTGNQQATKLNSPKAGIPVTVADGTDASPIECPATVTCWSETSEIHVDNGALFNSGFAVEIRIYKDLAQTVHGVYHQFDPGHLDSHGSPLAGESLTKCPKKGAPSHCFTVDGLGGGSILVTAYINENGKIGAF